MGRPLNKRFFDGSHGGPAGTYQVECNAYIDDGTVGSTASIIIQQKSNRKYLVQDLSTVASTALVVGVQNEIVTVGGADYTTVGAPNNTVGTVFTPTGVSAGGAGTVSQRGICKLEDRTPAAAGEMQVIVTPTAIAGFSTVQATVTTTTVGGAGTALATVVVANPGAGYWVDVASDTLAAGDGTISYTVDGFGGIATVEIATTGATNTAATLAIGDAPSATPDAANARIINARTVKTFGGTSTSSTYDWPPVATDGIARVDPNHYEADIGS